MRQRPKQGPSLFRGFFVWKPGGYLLHNLSYFVENTDLAEKRAAMEPQKKESQEADAGAKQAEIALQEAQKRLQEAQAHLQEAQNQLATRTQTHKTRQDELSLLETTRDTLIEQTQAFKNEPQ